MQNLLLMILILLLISQAGQGRSQDHEQDQDHEQEGPNAEIFAMRTCMSATVIDYRSAAAAAPEK